MTFFGFGKKPGFLGIDLGSTSLKLVELRKEKGVPALVTYGYAERAMGDIVRGDPKEVQKKAVELLKKLYQQTGAESYQVVTALPNFSVFNSVISLPVMNKKELSKAIAWEAKKVIPMPIEDVILDWKIIEEITVKKAPPKLQSKAQSQTSLKPANPSTGLNLEKTAEQTTPPSVASPGQKASAKDTTFAEALVTEKKEEPRPKEEGPVVFERPRKMYRILLTAASRILVKRYVEIFKLANLQLLSLETEAFALARALVGKSATTTMIIDTSALTTDIIIIEKGIPVLNRSIDVGGVTLTRAIANCLNIDFKRAEQFKRDIGLAGGSKIPSVIQQTLKPVVDEINYSLKLYQSQTGQVVEKVILSGGSSYLPNLTDFLTQSLNVKVLIGDPWARISYPKDLRPALEEVAPRFTVAIGLALRDLE